MQVHIKELPEVEPSYTCGAGRAGFTCTLNIRRQHISSQMLMPLICHATVGMEIITFSSVLKKKEMCTRSAARLPGVLRTSLS